MNITEQARLAEFLSSHHDAQTLQEMVAERRGRLSALETMARCAKTNTLDDAVQESRQALVVTRWAWREASAAERRAAQA